MSKVLILGAGMVVKPIVSFLLKEGYEVTVASRTKSKAEAVIGNHPKGQAIGWTVEEMDVLDKLVRDHDLTVSLLPFAYHVMVAEVCLKYAKNMVTTSYISEEMKKLNSRAEDKGVMILNEIGLDPGIDHMSAMRIIDNVHARGGKVDEFYSFCGALPEKNAANNPFKYRFSWSPRGVIMAGNNAARYKKNGGKVEVEGKDLFKDVRYINFPGIGEMEVYPNRNSLPYQGLYEIGESKTVMRGTIRYQGWSRIMDCFKSIGLLSNDVVDITGLSYAGFIRSLINANNSNGELKKVLAEACKVEENSRVIEAFEWLGLLSEEPIGKVKATPFDILADLMIPKMMLLGDDKDMVLLLHLFRVSFPDGTKEVIRSSMVDFGTLNTDTAVARTVALPAAIAVKMILEGKIRIAGVHIPNKPQIYNPVLDELEKLDIRMTEEYGLINDDTFL